MKKYILVLVVIFLSVSLVILTNKTKFFNQIEDNDIEDFSWQSLRAQAKESILDFDLLNLALNSTDELCITNGGNCFVYEKGSEDNNFVSYLYGYGEGGGAGATFKKLTNNPARYLLLYTDQESPSCVTVEKLKVPASFQRFCYNKDGKPFDREKNEIVLPGTPPFYPADTSN
jgi:hypothetical protein